MLLPAYQLYKNDCYRGLVNRFGLDNVYVLSAGWGLIRSDFLTPYYDITFNAQADDYKRRRTKDRYNDFDMLPNDTDEQIVFLGSKDYRPLFYTLTDGVRGERIVLFKSKYAPQKHSNGTFRNFETADPRNTRKWHYECAEALIDGNLSL